MILLLLACLVSGCEEPTAPEVPSEPVTLRRFSPVGVSGDRLDSIRRQRGMPFRCQDCHDANLSPPPGPLAEITRIGVMVGWRPGENRGPYDEVITLVPMEGEAGVVLDPMLGWGAGSRFEGRLDALEWERAADLLDASGYFLLPGSDHDEEFVLRGDRGHGDRAPPKAMIQVERSDGTQTWVTSMSFLADHESFWFLVRFLQGMAHAPPPP